MISSKLVILLILSLTAATLSAQNFNCEKYSKKKSVQLKFGDWLSKRTTSETIIKRIGALLKNDKIKGVEITALKSDYAKHSDSLNKILDDVVRRINANDLTAVLKGAKLTSAYESRFTPVLDSLDHVNQRMTAFYNGKAENPYNAAGGLDQLITVLINVLPALYEDAVKPIQIAKVNCLRWKKWDEIR